MPYVLCRLVLSSDHTIRITKKEYEHIKVACTGIGEIIGIEEKYDAVMENFVELEQSILQLGMRHLAFSNMDYHELQQPRNVVGRRLLNLLSSARLYRDSLPQHCKTIFGDKDARLGQVKALLRDSPKQPMAYRVVEAVRNYAQHQEIPVYGVTFHRASEGDGEERRSAHWLSFSLDALEVSRGRELSNDVRAELVSLGSKVDPMPLVRQYVEHVGTIQRAIREMIKGHDADWTGTITGGIRRFTRRFPKEKAIALAAGFQKPNGSISDAEYLVEEAVGYLKYLKSKNRSAVNLSQRYVKW